MSEETKPEIPKPALPMTKSAKEYAEEMLQKLNKAREVHALLSKNIHDELIISGQKMGYWEEKFKVKVPMNDLNPVLCMELAMEIMSLHQEATFFQAVAQARAQMIKKGTESSFNSRYWAIVQQYKGEGKRLPPQAQLEISARVDNEELEAAETIASVEVKFWKDILEHLHTARRLLETASLNISVDLKSQTQANYLEKMANKGAN